MPTMFAKVTVPALLTGVLFVPPAMADSLLFSTGNPDGLMATASRPDSAPAGTPSNEIESADDFVLTQPTSISSATFTGLLPQGALPSDIGQVVVEIYRVFPNDSDVNRTSGPPVFFTDNVPTRVNSPSDVEVDDRDTAAGNLSFSTTVLSTSFTADNSVKPGGIHPKPNQTTMGNGPVTGEEVQFTVNFSTPFDLNADHYFFVPQVELDDGTFMWLSTHHPIPFPTGFTDLQSWTRDAALEPDWLRVGTDIVGPIDGVTTVFNAAFSLTGSTVPEPSTWAMMLLGFAGLGYASLRQAWKPRTLL